jgi:hypothetical protein
MRRSEPESSIRNFRLVTLDSANKNTRARYACDRGASVFYYLKRDAFYTRIAISVPRGEAAFRTVPGFLSHKTNGDAM